MFFQALGTQALGNRPPRRWGAQFLCRVAMGLAILHHGAFAVRAQLVDFGAELLLHQDFLLIGAHNAAQGHGRVHLLQRTPAGWNSLGQLRPMKPPMQGFGYAMAMDERTLLVGGPLSVVGGVSLYPLTPRRPIDPNAVQPITFPDRHPYSQFGGSVAIGDGLVAVGAKMAGQTRQDTDGAVYVFRQEESEWKLVQKLVAPGEPGEALGRHFGSTVKFSLRNLVVGAPLEDDEHPTDSVGAIYVFPSTPEGIFDVETVQKLIPSRGSEVKFMASGLAVADHWIVAGAPLSTVENAEHSGAVLLFRRDRWGNFRPARFPRLDPPEVRRGGQFGTSVAMTDQWLAVLSPSYREWPGTLYLYRRGPDGEVSAEPEQVVPPPDGFRFRPELAMNEQRIALKGVRSGRESVEIYEPGKDGLFTRQYSISLARGVEFVGEPAVASGASPRSSRARRRRP